MDKYTNFLKPKMSFRYSPNGNRNITSKDIRLNYDNVYSLNRIGSNYQVEGGESLTLGLEFQRENKTSILLASHNMSEVERLCSSVLMMNKGAIIDQGTPDELINNHGRKNMEEVFLKLTRERV